MGLIKDVYNPVFYDDFANSLERVLSKFDRKSFVQQIFIPEFQTMEWKMRMKHTTSVLHTFMPEAFPEAADTIRALITQLRADGKGDDKLVYIFFADYIEARGLDHFRESVDLFEFVTQFISCEFAVRPFIMRYENLMLDEMLSWSLHESHHVRRLASEGSRPRLPWGMALPTLKADPNPVLPILNNLRDDPSEYVRRSVANNLNDISKDNPGLVLNIAQEWSGKNRTRDALIKHACRTLLKQGHPAILHHYGLNSAAMRVEDFRIITPEVSIGDYLKFSFQLRNTSIKRQTVRLEYAIHFLKANGQHGKKVFKISEREYEPAEINSISKRHSFRIITTKKFYPGIQRISIIVNGIEKAMGDFELKMS